MTDRFTSVHQHRSFKMQLTQLKIVLCINFEMNLWCIVFNIYASLKSAVESSSRWGYYIDLSDGEAYIKFAVLDIISSSKMIANSSRSTLFSFQIQKKWISPYNLGGYMALLVVLLKHKRTVELLPRFLLAAVYQTLLVCLFQIWANSLHQCPAPFLSLACRGRQTIPVIKSHLWCPKSCHETNNICSAKSCQ